MSSFARSGHRRAHRASPRHFAIDPKGAYLLAANQNCDSIVVFRIDAAKGTLTPAGKPVTFPRPVCILFAS
jgi:6-phosphogluconolactonase